MYARIIFVDDVDYISYCDKEVFVNHVLPYLEKNEILRLKNVSKRFKNFIDYYVEKECRKIEYITVEDYPWYLCMKKRFPTGKITKTIAKQEFKVTDKQLGSITYETMKKYRFVYYLYDLEEIIRLCMDRHRTVQELQLYGQKITDRSSKIRQNKEKLKDSREKELTQALAKIGLVIRDDSYLCKQYIEGKVNSNFPSLDSVVTRMAQMHYLYEYCNFEKYKRLAYEDIRQQGFLGYIYPGEISDTAESMALKKYGKYPETWPWLTNVYK